MVLFLLVILWVVVLFPPWWKSRTSRAGFSGRIDSLPLSRRNDTSLDALATVLTPQANNVVPFRRPGADSPLPLGSSMSTVSATPDLDGMTNDLARPTMQVSEDFFGGMAGLEGVTPISLEDARRRRRNLLVGLFGASVGLLVAAVIWQGVFVLAFLVSMAALLGCVMVIVSHQRSAERRRNRIEPIQPVGYRPPVQAAPQYLIQRTAQ